MRAARAFVAPTARRPMVVARRSRWAVVAVVSAFVSASCGVPPIDGAPTAVEPPGVDPPTVEQPVAEPPLPDDPGPIEPAPADPPVGPPASVRGIPLAEARSAGLWGRPTFTGCVSVHGTPSPPWFDADLLAAAGWPSSQWTNVCHVAGCESNFEAGRTGGLGNRMAGLLQLDRWSWGALAASVGHSPAELLTPLANLRVGRALFERLADAHGSGEAWLPSSLGGWSCAWAAR